LVKSYKFGSARHAAKIMATMMNDSLPYFATQPIITYVPTVPARMRSRGFDHAGILAKEIARQKNWITYRYLPGKCSPGS
jgi:predicted amidophosphoribosyltransferase